MEVLVATAALNQTPLDWSGNLRRLLAAADQLAEHCADSRAPDFLLFPELAISGYGCEDMFASPAVLRRALEQTVTFARGAAEVLPATVAVVGVPLLVSGQVFNCAAVVHAGRIVGVVPKSRLAGDGVHYEPRWFTAYSPATEAATELPLPDGSTVPFGRLIFAHAGIRAAVEICEDAWVAERPALDYAAADCDLILNPSASHFAFGKHGVRGRIVQESSRSFGLSYVLVNLLGNEAGRMIYDGDAIAASAGELLLSEQPFSFSDHHLSLVQLDIARDRVLRARTFSMQSYRSAARAARVRTVPVPQSAGERGRQQSIPGQEVTPRASLWTEIDDEDARLREFLRAVMLGLFDYLRKARVGGLVISLSGGADSAACLVIAERMLRHSFCELGPALALDRLGWSADLEELEMSLAAKGLSVGDCRQKEGLDLAVRFIAARRLHTIYQSTTNSSETTRTAAAAVAAACGSHHVEAPIDALVAGYRERVESALGRALSWATDDLALQNIQARVRSPLAWFLANATNSILITTSNRSEAAVGYCTMDGDTSGGLAPLSGIDKAFLRKWLVHMQEIGDPLGGPLGALANVTMQQPTAELRPLETHQTDEADLMPYELLDQIEKLAVRDRKPPLEVYRALRGNGVADADLKLYVRRFFVLWSRNQWKRERYAPSFHLDDENLDPRTWYRFPILSGAYADELRELEAGT